jgi:hypothetical protein
VRTEILVDGVWCWGQVWDWETNDDEWWAIVSACPQSGGTYIGRVPEDQVREASRPPTIPNPRRASVAAPRLSPAAAVPQRRHAP